MDEELKFGCVIGSLLIGLVLFIFGMTALSVHVIEAPRMELQKDYATAVVGAVADGLVRIVEAARDG